VGELLHPGLSEIGKRRIWKHKVPLHRALRGECGGSFTGDFERYVKEGSVGGPLSP
jgi:hypothetical protein